MGCDEGNPDDALTTGATGAISAGSWRLAAGVPGSSVHAIRPWLAAVRTPVHFPEVRSQTPGGA